MVKHRFQGRNNEALGCRADVKEGPQGPGPAIDMLGSPINKLSFLKTAVFVLNFKLWLP